MQTKNRDHLFLFEKIDKWNGVASLNAVCNLCCAQEEDAYVSEEVEFYLDNRYLYIAYLKITFLHLSASFELVSILLLRCCLSNFVESQRDEVSNPFRSVGTRTCTVVSIVVSMLLMVKPEMDACSSTNFLFVMAAIAK